MVAEKVETIALAVRDSLRQDRVRHFLRRWNALDCLPTQYRWKSTSTAISTFTGWPSFLPGSKRHVLTVSRAFSSRPCRASSRRGDSWACRRVDDDHQGASCLDIWLCGLLLKKFRIGRIDGARRSDPTAGRKTPPPMPRFFARTDASAISGANPAAAAGANSAQRTGAIRGNNGGGFWVAEVGQVIHRDLISGGTITVGSTASLGLKFLMTAVGGAS